MRIRFVTSVALPMGGYRQGRVYDVLPDVAARHVQAGHAVSLEAPAEDETAAVELEPAERAVLPRGRKRAARELAG